ncbi:MAG: hypothetical protein AVDCRST_MAG38-720 [uncultured Solirubrobacteraceae bacterium]|uniref:Flippase-like domain-containing protein n=1 Tax=uncultured Solirubrobacteraceae bacterium TaxID=1162706 RepID=A0A6J4R5L8_9ACTN|nr:MAG: hypothetical protein AVDCRST_MAG38-720 [uncultured Solirubrobacteraceae bacterium]
MAMSIAPASGPAPALPDSRHLRHRLMAAGVAVALAGAAVAAVPGLAGVRERFAAASPGWLAAALVLELGSCLAFVAVFRGVFAPRLAWGQSYHLGMAAQGTNVLLPSGGASGLALGAWVLSRMGVPAAQLGVRGVAFFVVTSAVNFATVAVVGTALAVGLLAGDLPLALTAGPALLAAVAMAVVAVGPGRLPVPHGAGGRADRILVAVHTALSGGIREAGRLLAGGNPLIVAGAIGYMFFDVAALGAAFAAVASLPSIGLLLVAYVVGQLGGLLPVPGGVGGADGGLIAALVIYGIPLGEAAAAVLAYRAFQLGLPALLGTLAVTRLPGVLSAGPDGASSARQAPVGPVPIAAASGAPVA